MIGSIVEEFLVRRGVSGSFTSTIHVLYLFAFMFIRGLECSILQSGGHRLKLTCPVVQLTVGLWCTSQSCPNSMSVCPMSSTRGSIRSLCPLISRVMSATLLTTFCLFGDPSAFTTSS